MCFVFGLVSCHSTDFLFSICTFKFHSFIHSFIIMTKWLAWFWMPDHILFIIKCVMILYSVIYFIHLLIYLFVCYIYNFQTFVFYMFWYSSVCSEIIKYIFIYLFIHSFIIYLFILILFYLFILEESSIHPDCHWCQTHCLQEVKCSKNLVE